MPTLCRNTSRCVSPLHAPQLAHVSGPALVSAPILLLLVPVSLPFSPHAALLDPTQAFVSQVGVLRSTTLQMSAVMMTFRGHRDPGVPVVLVSSAQNSMPSVKQTCTWLCCPCARVLEEFASWIVQSPHAQSTNAWPKRLYRLSRLAYLGPVTWHQCQCQLTSIQLEYHNDSPQLLPIT